MCGNGRRAARYQNSCGRGYAAPSQASAIGGGGAGLGAIVNAIQELKLAGHGIDSRAPFGISHTSQYAPVEPQQNGVERGIVRDTPYLDEKKQPQLQHPVQFEVLPTYEESTVPRSAQPAVSVTNSEAFRPMAQNSQVVGGAARQENVLVTLESFRQSLLAYRQGAKGAKYEAKTAARKFVRDLFDQEMARRRAEKGRLECGERKLVKRDLKPVKQLLKSAVWDARQERLGRV